jgi:integrase
MRTGEVDGLQWRYVDFDRRLILVRETLVRGRVEYTKTDGSQRDIQMSSPVYETLRAQREITGEGRFVFCTDTGAPLNHNNVTKRIWYPILRHLGSEKRRPYQTRHTAATLWLAACGFWVARASGGAGLARTTRSAPRDTCCPARSPDIASSNTTTRS